MKKYRQKPRLDTLQRRSIWLEDRVGVWLPAATFRLRTGHGRLRTATNGYERLRTVLIWRMQGGCVSIPYFYIIYSRGPVREFWFL
jgi:hypothetical protein